MRTFSKLTTGDKVIILVEGRNAEAAEVISCNQGILILKWPYGGTYHCIVDPDSGYYWNASGNIEIWVDLSKSLEKSLESLCTPEECLKIIDEVFF